MESRIPGFAGEYLWELDVPRIQLLSLAEAVPEELYGWRPAEGTRSFSAVLVHIAAGNFTLLRMAGRAAPGGVDLYGPVEGDELTRLAAMIGRNVSLEKTLTDKAGVMDLLRQAFEAIRQCFTESSIEDLEKVGEFFGERTTLRRVYLRMLAHSHEHMGQAIAYARTMGIGMPWPDPLKELDNMVAEARSRAETRRYYSETAVGGAGLQPARAGEIACPTTARSQPVQSVPGRRRC
jgi:hypothetical protein